MERAFASPLTHKLRLALFALVILSTAGCIATDDVIDVVFDPCSPTMVTVSSSVDAGETLDPRHVVAIEQAIVLWSSVLPISAKWSDASEQPSSLEVDIQPAHEPSVLFVSFRELSPILNGTYRDEEGEILVNNQLEENEQAVTLAHEMGHAFGLLHVGTDSRPSVMNAGNTTTAPTVEDAELLRTMWSSCNATTTTSP